MAERNASLGYAAIGKQTNSLTPVTPTIFTPYYKQSMATNMNVIKDNPVYGNKFKNFQILPGLRDHQGSIDIMAEPNSIANWFDMFLTKSSDSGSNPATHVFGLSSTQDPNFYTLDISLVSQVARFWGVGASKMTVGWKNDEMILTANLSGLGSFLGRQIATISTTTITLDTTYDPKPNVGLVVGDLVRITKTDGSSTLDTTVATVNADGITVTLGASAAAFAAGDMIVLRPATPNLSLLTPFLWATTQYCFGATAAAALSAAQTRIEQGASLDLVHEFESNTGSKRSGAFDPASLPRTGGDISFKVKKFFDTPDELKNFINNTKRACVMRAYSGSQYEFRVTMNNLHINGPLTPTTEFDKIIYQELPYAAQYDSTDGQGMGVTVINANATV